MASKRPSVTILSPHFDDVPLSLGQSLRDGALADAKVRVRVVFGNTNWTRWVHPTPGRAVPISWWRRFEEQLAALQFGYRFGWERWPEIILRTGEMEETALLNPDTDLSAEPLVAEISAWVTELVAGMDDDALLLAPAGLGGHLDHRIVAAAVAGALARIGCHVGFYEDRPYVSFIDPDDLAAQLPRVEGLEAVDVSGPVQESTQRRIHRSYPSQMTHYFDDAMALDLEGSARERVWFPPGRRPDWLVG